MARPIIDHERCERCDLCERCIELCPGLGVDEENDKIYVLEKECGGCTDCVEECPLGAITMVGG